jgi:PAS domain-containing protein
VLPPETFRTRTALAAAVGLVLLATTSVLLDLLADRTWRIAASAAIWAVGAVLLGWLVYRAAAQERVHRADLARAETRYRALLDGLPLVTWLTDPGDRRSSLYVSPSISELTGYSPAEWLEEPGLF